MFCWYFKVKIESLWSTRAYLFEKCPIPKPGNPRWDRTAVVRACNDAYFKFASISVPSYFKWYNNHSEKHKLLGQVFWGVTGHSFLKFINKVIIIMNNGTPIVIINSFPSTESYTYGHITASALPVEDQTVSHSSISHLLLFFSNRMTSPLDLPIPT